MEFTTGQILSAGTGVLCCKVEDLYKIYNFLTGETLFTHQLLRAYKACKEHILKQCPWLKDINSDEITKENWTVFVGEVSEQYGLMHDLKPLPDGIWNHINPIEGLSHMVGEENIVVVNH